MPTLFRSPARALAAGLVLTVGAATAAFALASARLSVGAQTDFAVLFSVPKGTALKDLVFSLQNAYEDTPDGGTDVRIALGS